MTMEEGPQLSVVLPVYNEGDAVAPVIRALVEGIHVPCEILVVYDFDEDTTVPVARALAAELPSVKPLRNEFGRGVLNAMKAGIAAARAPYVLVSMADGSDEPEVVDRIVELARDGADVVAASRYMRGGHQIGGPPLKRLMSRIAGLSLHWFAGVPIHDPTNNFKLYSRRFLDTVTIESTNNSSWRSSCWSRRHWPDAASPRCQPPGAIERPGRATSSSASGCPTTCTGISPHSEAGSRGSWADIRRPSACR